MFPAGLPTAVLAGPAGRLERAVAYTRTSLTLITARSMRARTPCAHWDLAQLLDHMYDSLCAIQEAADFGDVPLQPVLPAVPGPPVITAIRDRACSLLGAWMVTDREYAAVGGRRTGTDLLAAAAAIEITVHGWDVARACGDDRSVPEEFAEDLLEVAGVVIDESDRPGRFAVPVVLTGAATASDRLIASTGRDPRRGR